MSGDQAVPLPDEAVRLAAEALNDGLPGGLLLDGGPAWRAAKRALTAAMPALWSHFFRTSHDLKLMLEAARSTGRAQGAAGERARVAELVHREILLYRDDSGGRSGVNGLLTELDGTIAELLDGDTGPVIDTGYMSLAADVQQAAEEGTDGN